MVVHDLCSSGLFCLSNISYERFSGGSFLINKGLINLIPSMAMWSSLLSSCNIAAPLSLNLIGEIGLLSSLISLSWCLTFVLTFFCLFSVLLILFIYILIVSKGLFILGFIIFLWVIFVISCCCSYIDFRWISLFWSQMLLFFGV